MTAAPPVDVGRLVALVARQRRELELLRAQAAARSVVDLAQGVLMERLACDAAEAGRQLARLAHESGTPLAELAAEVVGQRMGRALDPASSANLGWRRVSMAAAAMQCAEDGDGIAEAALAEALADTGACAIGLWQLRPDGGLELAGQAGLGLREAARWRLLPPDMDCPARRAVAEGGALIWPAGVRAEGIPAAGSWAGGARAALPLREAGSCVGAMEVRWPRPLPAFQPALRRQLEALADLCARTLTAPGLAVPPADHGTSWLYALLDGLLESVMVAHPMRGDDGAVADFRIGYLSAGFTDPGGRRPGDLTGSTLLAAYPLAACPDGLFDTAARVLAAGEPAHLPPAAPSGVAGEGGLAPLDIRVAPLGDGVVIAWRRMDDAERLASLLGHAERLGRLGGWEEDLLAGEARWSESACALFGRAPGHPIALADLQHHVAADDVAEVEQFRRTLLHEQKATAVAFRMVRPDDESVRHLRAFAEPVTDPAGVVAAVRGAFQDVSATYHTQVALTATEERAEEEHRLATRLQQAITPWSPEPIVTAGLDVAARYRPAGPGHLVSGDWYDTLLLPSQQVLLTVGDIAGHGIDAVTGMVALRNCLRGLAFTGAGPGELLRWLNDVACHVTEGTIGTAICGLYDPVHRTLRWARAGHLPPVLVRDGVARMLDPPSGLLLGADADTGYGEAVTSLQPADVLLLFTDGLIERRGEAIDDALGSLMTVAGRKVADVAGYADELLRLSGSDTGDDACLLAIRVR